MSGGEAGDRLASAAPVPAAATSTTAPPRRRHLAPAPPGRQLRRRCRRPLAPATGWLVRACPFLGHRFPLTKHPSGFISGNRRCHTRATPSDCVWLFASVRQRQGDPVGSRPGPFEIKVFDLTRTWHACIHGHVPPRHPGRRRGGVPRRPGRAARGRAGPGRAGGGNGRRRRRGRPARAGGRGPRGRGDQRADVAVAVRRGLDRDRQERAERRQGHRRRADEVRRQPGARRGGDPHPRGRRQGQGARHRPHQGRRRPSSAAPS